MIRSGTVVYVKRKKDLEDQIKSLEDLIATPIPSKRGRINLQFQKKCLRNCQRNLKRLIKVIGQDSDKCIMRDEICLIRKEIGL